MKTLTSIFSIFLLSLPTAYAQLTVEVESGYNFTHVHFADVGVRVTLF